MQQPLPILLSTLLVTTSAAYADSPWSVAGGVIAVDSPYANTDTKVMALPMINYQGEKLTLRGYTLDYTLLQQHGFSWSATLAPGQFFDSSDSDNPAIKALNERKMSLYAGTKVSYAANFGRLNASVTHDILGHSDGLKFNGDYNYSIIFSKELILTPFIGVIINSSNVSNYYYGVAAGESTRYAPYQLGSTVNYNAGLSLRYQLNKNWHLNGLVKYTQLDADIEDSPIVDSDNIATTMLSVSYQF